MKIFWKIMLVLLVFILAYLLSYPFGGIYGNLFTGTGSFVDTTSVLGFPLAYIFFLPLLFTAFGGAGKYWWLGIVLIPALWFEIYFDLSYIYFPIALGLVGWFIGFGISKIFRFNLKI